MVYATFMYSVKPKKNPKQKMLHKNKIVVASGTGTYSGSESFAGIQAEKQRFCPQKIMEKVPEDLLHKQISDELFERDYTTIQQQIDEFKKR